MLKRFVSALALLVSFAAPTSILAQGTPAPANDSPASAVLATRPWEFGPFFQGGVGIGDRSDFSFTSAGVRLGKVMTDEHLGGIFRGQFEYAGELMPYWQSFTPPPHLQSTECICDGVPGRVDLPVNGGTFTGVSITPIILRWNFKPGKRIAPWAQGAGGLIWTNHKYPPDFIVPKGNPTGGGTSV